MTTAAIAGIAALSAAMSFGLAGMVWGYCISERDAEKVRANHRALLRKVRALEAEKAELLEDRAGLEAFLAVVVPSTTEDAA